MTIAPFNDPRDIHTPEKFREYVEALEVAREFLEAGTPARIRLALIVLDNTAEILMYRFCGELFRCDQFHSRILPPRFAKRLKMQVLWKFPEKSASSRRKRFSLRLMRQYWPRPTRIGIKRFTTMLITPEAHERSRRSCLALRAGSSPRPAGVSWLAVSETTKPRGSGSTACPQVTSNSVRRL
jgi:hypothetical protein